NRPHVAGDHGARRSGGVDDTMKRDPATKEATVGKVVVTEFISLDGVIEAPGDPTEYERGGWATGGGQEGMQFKFDELMASDVQLLGRITYEGFAKAWPTMEGTGEFGEKMNEMPKFVVSTTL